MIMALYMIVVLTYLHNILTFPYLGAGIYLIKIIKHFPYELKHQEYFILSIVKSKTNLRFIFILLFAYFGAKLMNRTVTHLIYTFGK